MKKIYFLIIFLGFALITFSQNVLKGKVMREDKEILVGVNVYEKGTSNGTITDYNGNYVIRYTSKKAVIVFSYVGYIRQEVEAGNQTSLNITLIQNVNLQGIEVVGSRNINRSSTESAAPVDIFEMSKITATLGNPDVNQILQYVAPSFNSNKQSGADGADHIDPATLRGLGPDQTLVLINGKRRHQSSLINIFGTRGRGNTGTDLNAIPAASIDHIEILRDGASAQYGSDAIAGVINVVLKSDTNEFSGNLAFGARNAKAITSNGMVDSGKKFDGQTFQANVNYGTGIGKKGFLDLTVDYLKQDATLRKADTAKYAVYRNKFGDAASENFSTYFNLSVNAGKNGRFYSFGGFNYRFTDAYAFSRDATEERNVIGIYPNGFDPKIQSVITDKCLTAGYRTLMKGWNLDFSNTFGTNRFHFFVDNSLNSSLVNKSPTRFDAGGFSLLQNTVNLDLSRYFKVMHGLNLAFGLEQRIENYTIFAGDEASYKTYGKVIFSIDSVTHDTVYRPGGSQGFPGFQPDNVVNESRSNVGIYADGELDVARPFTIGLAGRYEHYSDFGSALSGKLALRYKITSWLSIRGSVSNGFRAPSLAQLYYNTIFTDIVAGQAIDKIIAKNNSPITAALGIPKLKQEASVNLSGGITAKYHSLSITLDIYHVTIKDRIVLTGAFTSDDPDIGAELKKLNVGAAQFFTNAVNTSTTGLDGIVSYALVFAHKHILRLSFAGNFNNMNIDKTYTNDKLKGKEMIYFGKREQYFLLASAPKSKMNLGIEYSVRNFFANLRFTRFGKVELVNWNDNGDNIVDPAELDTYKPKITTDLCLGYHFWEKLTLTLGGDNILNQYPDHHDPALTESGGIWDAVQMGFSGAYYYARLGINF